MELKENKKTLSALIAKARELLEKYNDAKKRGEAIIEMNEEVNFQLNILKKKLEDEQLKTRQLQQRLEEEKKKRGIEEEERLEKEEIKTRKEQFGFNEEKRESIREELRKVEFQNEIRALESGFKNLLS